MLAWGSQARIQSFTVGKYHNSSRNFLDVAMTQNRLLHFEKETAIFVRVKLQVIGEGAHGRCGLSEHAHADITIPFISSLIFYCILFHGNHVPPGWWKWQAGVLSSALIKRKKYLHLGLIHFPFKNNYNFIYSLPKLKTYFHHVLVVLIYLDSFDPVTLNLYGFCTQSTMICSFWGLQHIGGKN